MLAWFPAVSPYNTIEFIDVSFNNLDVSFYNTYVSFYNSDVSLQNETVEGSVFGWLESHSDMGCVICVV